MRTKKRPFLILAIALAASGAAVASLAPAQASTSDSSANPAAVTAARDSWIDAGGVERWVIARLNGAEAGSKIFHGTTFRMVCWYDDPISRRFYGEFTSGKFKGVYGNITAGVVRNQVSTPHCD